MQHAIDFSGESTPTRRAIDKSRGAAAVGREASVICQARAKPPGVMGADSFRAAPVRKRFLGFADPRPVDPGELTFLGVDTRAPYLSEYPGGDGGGAAGQLQDRGRHVSGRNRIMALLRVVVPGRVAKGRGATVPSADLQEGLAEHPTVGYTCRIGVTMTTHRFTIILERETDGGFHAFCPALKGCHSQGDTLDESLNNIRETIEAYLESVEAHGEPIPREDLLFKPIEVAR